MQRGEAQLPTGLPKRRFILQVLAGQKLGGQPLAIVDGNASQGEAGGFQRTTRIRWGRLLGVERCLSRGVDEARIDDVSGKIDDVGIGRRFEVGSDGCDQTIADHHGGGREFLFWTHHDPGVDQGPGIRLKSGGSGSLSQSEHGGDCQTDGQRLKQANSHGVRSE